MFRLYVGLLLGGKWYNHAEAEEICGGTLSILDTPDRSSTAKLLSLVKHSVKKVYTGDKSDSRELKDHEYLQIRIQDGWKIAMEVMKQMAGQEKPVFQEHFYCGRCSRPGLERYTEVNESWQGLVEKGMIDENYIEKYEDVRMDIELPNGFKVPPIGNFAGGTFKNISVEPLTFGEQLEIVNTPGIQDTESSLVYAMLDMKIKAVKGMTEKDITRFIRRMIGEESFSKRFLAKNEDFESIDSQTVRIGLDAENRRVTCKNCHAQIGGYLDFTNFFDFLRLERSRHAGRMNRESI